MPRVKTLSFVAEFPLQTTAADEKTLDTRLNAARHLYNACLQESLRRLDLMKQSKAWQAARAMPATVDKRHNKARSQAFGAETERFGFTSREIEKHALSCRNACWIGDHLGSHDTQTTSCARSGQPQQYAFGKRGRPRFKSLNRLNSIEGKADAVIRYRAEPVPAVHYSGLVLPLMLNPKDKRDWQREALAARTKYVRIIRREIKGRVRWFCQLVQEGLPPATHTTKDGTVNQHRAISSIAAVSSDDAILEQLCRASSNRGTTAGGSSARWTARDVQPTWTTSMPKGARSRVREGGTGRSAMRRLPLRNASAIEYWLPSASDQHGELANRILGQGTTIKTEE